MNLEEYKNLIKPKKQYSQEEKQLQMSFGQMLQLYEKAGKLSPNLIKYSYIANGEQRPAKIVNGKRFSKVGADLKKKGVKKGIFDYYFLMDWEGIGHEIWLEAKSKNGKLTPEQIDFSVKIRGLMNVHFYEFRSVEEGLNFLKEQKILLI